MIFSIGLALAFWAILNEKPKKTRAKPIGKELESEPILITQEVCYVNCQDIFLQLDYYSRFPTFPHTR